MKRNKNNTIFVEAEWLPMFSNETKKVYELYMLRLFQQRGNSSIYFVLQKFIYTFPKIFCVTIVNVFDGDFDVFVCFIINPFLKGTLKLSEKLEVMRLATVSVNSRLFQPISSNEYGCEKQQIFINRICCSEAN